MLAEKFIDSTLDRLTALSSQLQAVKSTGEMIAQAVMNGKKVYIADRFSIIDMETVERSSNLALFRSYKADMNDLTDGDVVILASLYTDDTADMALISTVRSKNAVVVTISPEGPFSEAADKALTYPDGDTNGIVRIPGMDDPFCPVSGIMNATMIWMLAAEITETLIRNNTVPSVYWGEHIVGSEGKDSETRKRYASLGY